VNAEAVNDEPDAEITERPEHNDPLLKRIVLRNYKSIADCDVSLGRLNFFVGANGAGKSNFLDALRLVADSLRTSLDQALRERGGISEVRRRSTGHPNHFAVRLDLHLEDGSRATYGFSIGSRPQGGYRVADEHCQVWGKNSTESPASFHVAGGVVTSSVQEHPPAAFEDRLYLVAASGLPAFRPVHDALSRMAFYNLSPDAIRDLQSPDAGELLARDGYNLASVLANMDVETRQRVDEYLQVVVPGIKGAERKSLGQWETIEFRQEVAGSSTPWRFQAASMSDGTLRALGVLAALYQGSNGSSKPVPVVGIEEPEVALHPKALAVLLDALREASVSRQVIVTSHSPDLLDNKDLDPQALFAVVSIRGSTIIGHLDDAGRSALRDHLYTAGELLSMDMLRPATQQMLDL